MKVSLFKNLGDSNINGVATVDDVLQMIKNGHTKQLVELARSYGRGTPSYQLVKSKIETFTPHGEFFHRRATRNLQQFSGFIYLDVDGLTNKTIFTETNFIYACWDSLSKEGIGALARVDGLDYINFKTVWLYLADYFKQKGITIDPQTKDIARQNIISYDPNIYINKGCVVLDANQIYESYSAKTISNQTVSYTSSTTNPPTTNYCSSYSTINTDLFNDNDVVELFRKIKYNTTLDSYENKDYVVIETGKNCRNAFIPKVIKDGERHLWLSSFTITLLFNNPSISFQQLSNLVLNVNRNNCNPSLDTKEVINLTKWYYDKFVNNSLTIRTKLKKIWINPEAELTLKQKRTIISKETGNLRRKKTLLAIQCAYDALKKENKDVTQKMVYNSLKKSLRTIKYYWSDIKK